MPETIHIQLSNYIFYRIKHTPKTLIETLEKLILKIIKSKQKKPKTQKKN